MKELGGTLVTLAWFFALLSLFAIGGGNSAIPEMHRFAVDVQHWLSDPQFADSSALAQLTPGPNLIIVALIGYHVAGIVGALVATVSMCGPTACSLSSSAARPKGSGRGLAMVLAGDLVPVTIGSPRRAPSSWRRAADDTQVAVGITVVAALMTYWIRVNPLWIFAVAALLGLSGVV